jgi:hypothetical protein
VRKKVASFDNIGGIVDHDNIGRIVDHYCFSS